MASAWGTDLNCLFRNGLVFGFDIGTGSLGYAVRRGKVFLEAGVLVFPEDVGDLSKRRDLRRQRRTLRSRRLRLRALRDRLEGAGLPRPADHDRRPAWKDPVLLRLAAVRGEEITPEDLHAALFHLLRRRGYARVPWAKPEEWKDAQEEAEVLAAVEDIRKEMEKRGEEFPCEWLARRGREGRNRRGKSDDRVVFPRDLVEKEFRAIVAAQEDRHPGLAKAADEILYGPEDLGRVIRRDRDAFRVFFKKTDAPLAGVMALYWPRFANRKPGLDRFRARDDEGRPLHRARRNKDEVVRGNFFLALQNFRLVDLETQELVEPPKSFRDALIETWNKKGKVEKRDLKGLVDEHAPGHALLEDQPALTPSNLSRGGRSAYSRPTLREIAATIEGGKRFDPPPPRLRYEEESREEAIRRRLHEEIVHPLVRHRAAEYVQLLHRLVSRHGKPDLVVVEAVREIAQGKKAKQKVRKIQKENEDRRKKAEKKLEKLGLSSASRKKVQIASLLEETGWTCPYCLKNVSQTDFREDRVEIDHIVPRSRFPTNDWNNLTAVHRACNTKKGDMTPFEAFGKTDLWPTIEEKVRAWFRPRKRAVFLSKNPEKLLEDRAKLAETAYIARVLRGLTCLELGWETEDGRDPSAEPGAVPRFQVTNGSLTSFLRDEWNLNAVLYPLGSGASDEERIANRKKNRADVRHHAVDAMVVASTLPWEVHDRIRNRHGGGTTFDNPAGLDFESVREWVDADRIKVEFRSPTGWRAQRYNTTFLGRRTRKADAPVFVAREAISGMSEKKKKKKFEKIYPPELADYIREARKKHPKDFLDRLCFAAFQRWREEGRRKGKDPEVVLPDAKDVKIPIRRVRVVRARDEKGLLPLRREGEGGPWVERTGFLEVRIYKTPDGDLEPVFVPHSRLDPMYEAVREREEEGRRPLKTIRRGDVVRMAGTDSFPAGKYRIETLGRATVTIVPHFASRERGAPKAFGLPKSGGIRLKTFLKALDLGG